MALLTDKERTDFLAAHPDWTSDGSAIERTFRFADFNEAIGFVTRVALASEVSDHHPDIDIRWNRVTIVLSTHEEGGLTSKDTALATQITTLT